MSYIDIKRGVRESIVLWGEALKCRNSLDSRVYASTIEELDIAISTLVKEIKEAENDKAKK